MGKKYLLDSNTIIDYVARLYPDNTREWFNSIIDEEINVSIVTKIEVLSFDPDKDDNYPILIELFDVANIFDLSDEIVSTTIKLRQKQKIKLPDAIIAATALVNGLSLITRNARDFIKIKGLEIIDPYSL
jgi:predicted nucleic acid-binding protein